MLDLVKELAHKLLGADDPGVSEVSTSVCRKQRGMRSLLRFNSHRSLTVNLEHADPYVFMPIIFLSAYQRLSAANFITL